MLFVFYLIFIIIAFMIAQSRRINLSCLFVVTTLLIPIIGIIWAFVGENKYIRWDKADIQEASYKELKDALPYIDADLKSFARKELAQQKKDLGIKR